MSKPKELAMPRLEQLTVLNFRGASNRLRLDFDAQKPITVIFGENGTGKTTITDALDAIGNGSIGSLNDRSSVKAKDHLPTIGKASKDIEIELKTGGRSWKAVVGKDGVPIASDPSLKIRVLRRSQVMQLVNAPPMERYKELQRFIDVGGVERSEAALKDACTSAKRNLDTAITQRTTAEHLLQQVWEKEGKPGLGALKWAAEVAKADPTVLTQQAKNYREASTQIETAKTMLMDFDLAISTVAAKQAEAVQVEAEAEKLPTTAGPQVIALAGLLRKASEFLSTGTHDDQCPVCRQGIPLAQLKADIQERLKAFASFEAVGTRREAGTQAVQVAKQAAVPQQNKFLTAARLLLPLLQRTDLAPIKALGLNADQYPELAKLEGTQAELAIQEGRVLVGILGPIAKDLLLAETAASQKVGQISSVKVQYKAYEESLTTTEALDKVQAALEKALSLVRKVRINFTQGILDSVTGECNRLYACVHPNEKLALSKLELDPDKRASLNQKATFEGHTGVPPQAYFSESHLDTLGFCFWLALTKREFPGKDAVLVLDDVFTSVDSQHLSRLSQLVVDESPHFAHLIVMTHQRMWRDIYRTPHGAGRRTQLIELQDWSLLKGIKDYRTRLAVDDLISAIKAAPFDRQPTACQAGILLEAVLDGLALHYRCRVARTPDGNYTLGELLDGTGTLFKKLEIHRPRLNGSGQPQDPTGHDISKADSIVDEIRKLAFVRNQVGAHFNPLGAEIPDRDIRIFADLTVQLAQALSCSVCGQIPGKKTDAHFQCSCPAPKEVRMLPTQV